MRLRVRKRVCGEGKMGWQIPAKLMFEDWQRVIMDRQNMGGGHGV